MAKTISANKLKEINGGEGSTNCYVPAYQIVSGLEGYDTIHYLEKCNSLETAKSNAVAIATSLLNKCKTYVFVNYFVYLETNGNLTKVVEGAVKR